MSTADWDSARRSWIGILGDDRVLEASTRLANTAGLERSVPLVLKPKTVDQVQPLVEVAHRHHTPLYPISTGKNWGLGSALPPLDGTAIIDLGDLNVIREVNEQHAYAVIEPGVTQDQLHAYLAEHHPSLMFNVTGSSGATSILGNSLERGIGYMSSRTDSLTGLEVVLGDGQRLQTGFGRYPQSRITHIVPHGIGPSLDGLFFQSGFGVVTAAGFKLSRRPETMACVVCKLSDEAKLPSFIEHLGSLAGDGLVDAVVHIGNRARTRVTLEPLLDLELNRLYPEWETSRRRSCASGLLDKEGFNSWSAVIGLHGSPAQVKLAERALRSRMKGLGQIRFLSEDLLSLPKRILKATSFMAQNRHRLALLNALAPLIGFSANRPSNAAVGSVFWPVELPPDTKHWDEVDQSDAGMLYCLPFLPIDGPFTVDQINHVESFCRNAGFPAPAITANLVDGSAMELVISIAFDKRVPQQVEDAHQCIRELTDHFIRIGCPPYRVGIQSMDQIVDPTSPYWQYIRRLKQVFDPHGIISPGRYNID
jgi:4-cresol dehydrogenase (hydroxylating) flavoprotein subunit